MADRICSTDECIRPVVARGLCSPHYKRLRRAGLPPLPAREPRSCEIDGCERPHASRGWCATHYGRWLRYGRLDLLPAQEPDECSVEGCKRDARARGLCKAHHYRAQQNGGDPGAAQFIARGQVAGDKKLCTACDAWKSLGEFPKGHGAGGRNSPCYECRRDANAEFRAAHPTYWRDRREANPDKVRDARQKYRATLSAATVEDVDRRVVFARDGYLCMLCGDPLDMDAEFPDPNYPTIDHILALSVGGDHSYANVQAAHFRCNTAKGNR